MKVDFPNRLAQSDVRRGGGASHRFIRSLGNAHMWESLSRITLLAVLVTTSYSAADPRWCVDIESGAVFTGYNDVCIPGDVGTLISLSEELTTNPAFFLRGRLTYRIADRHAIGLLVAPLRLHGEGSVGKTVRFEDEEFAPHIPLIAVYEFNSYRLTYHYGVLRSRNLEMDIGLTGKIRDAAIRLEGNGQAVEKRNTGFVPLIHFGILWKFANEFALLLNGDALAAPQGRAEDILCALCYEAHPNVQIKLGYRILEGGADVSEVYNFALLHYVVAGVVCSF